MELWQVDVMGSVFLTNGIGLSVVTGIDDHSRFCVTAKVVTRTTPRPVCDALLEALNTYGPPEQILTDNGKVFTGRLGRRPATVLFDRICLNNGIRHLLTAPYSPTTTGKIERLHKTLRKEFFSDKSFETIDEMQAAEDILAAAREAGIIGKIGLYIGCGNGRNYLPLVRGGLDLMGVDISKTAIDQLSKRAPDRRDRLVAGDLSSLPAEERYPVVIGIQVFQHGDRESAHTHIRAAQARTAPGGLLCIRGNAVGTDFVYQHDVIERSDDGGFTVRYLEGPKTGLHVHFFSERELEELFAEAFHAVLPLRRQVTHRAPSGTGQWSQWEAISRRNFTS